jgi:hypothetical protein
MRNKTAVCHPSSRTGGTPSLQRPEPWLRNPETSMFFADFSFGHMSLAVTLKARVGMWEFGRDGMDVNPRYSRL